MVESRRIVPTGRSLNKILHLHGLDAANLADMIVFDLGCGRSDIKGELAERGFQADVTGFDADPRLAERPNNRVVLTPRVQAELNKIPAPDESADVVIATYSLPLFGETAEEIEGFYKECVRLPKVGGLLAVFPITAAITQGKPENLPSRLSAARTGALAIRQSPQWLSYNNNPEALLVRKLAPLT